MEERIIKLEILSVLQDETIRELNQELYRQQQDADRLRRRIEAIEKKFTELGNPDEIAVSEKPPHY
jgi:uncharacterized coiled-coil protein SlyX